MGCTSSKALGGADGPGQPERAPPPPQPAPAPGPAAPGGPAASSGPAAAPAPAPVNSTPQPVPASLPSGRASLPVDPERRLSVPEGGAAPAPVPSHPQLSPQAPRRSANALAANPHLAYLTGGGRHRDHHGGSAGSGVPGASGTSGGGGSHASLSSSAGGIKRSGSLGHSIDKRALPELPTAMVLAAALNDVAYFHKVFSLLAAKAVRDAAKARASSSVVGFTLEAAGSASSGMPSITQRSDDTAAAAATSSSSSSSAAAGGEEAGAAGPTPASTSSSTGAGAAPQHPATAPESLLMGPAAVLSPIPSEPATTATASSAASGSPSAEAAAGPDAPPAAAVPPAAAAAPAPQPPQAASRPPIHAPSSSSAAPLHPRLAGIVAPVSRESSFNASDVGLSLGGSMTPLSGSFSGTPSTPKPAPAVCVSTLACFVDKRMHGDNILQIAAAAGAVDVVALFLDADPSLSGITRAQTGNSLLHYAALGPAHVSEIFKAVRTHLLHNPDLLTLESEVLHAGEEAGASGRIEAPVSRSGSFASLADAGAASSGSGGATPGTISLPRTWSGAGGGWGASGSGTPLPPAAAAAAATASSSASIKMTGLQYLQSVLAAQASAVGAEYAAHAASSHAHHHHSSGFGSLTRRLGLGGRSDRDKEGTIQAPHGGRTSSGGSLTGSFAEGVGGGGERPGTPHGDGHGQHHPACSFAFAFAGASGTTTPPSTPASGVPAAAGTARTGFGFGSSSGSGGMTPSSSGGNLAGMVASSNGGDASSRRRSALAQQAGNSSEDGVGSDSASVRASATGLSIKKPAEAGGEGSGSSSSSRPSSSVLTSFKGPRLQLGPPPAAPSEPSSDTPRAPSASCGLLLPAGAGGPAFLDLLLLRPASTAGALAAPPATLPSANSPVLVALVELTDLYHRFPARSVERTIAALLARATTPACASKRNTFGKTPLDIAASHASQINPESTSSALSTGNILVEGGFWDRLVHPIHADWEEVRRALAAATATAGSGAKA